MAQHELPDISAHPLNNMNTDLIETAAATLEALGVTVGDNGSQAVAAWAPISNAYKGPGDAELIAVMAPVGTMSTEVKDRTAAAARSLRTFKDTADEIKASMTTLKADLVTHISNVNNYEPPAPTTTTTTGSYGTTTTTSGSYNGSWNAYGAAPASDWRDDDDLVAENERILKGLNDAVERLHEAERTCINEIRALHSLTPLTAGDGGYENGEYGIDSIPHEAETPWGTASPDDENCAEAAGSWVVGALQDIGGLVGMAWDEDGNWSWTLDNFFETWTGMASLITYNPETGQWFDWGHAGETWLGVGKDFLAWDRWAENPEGALTDVVLNVGSIFLGGAGIVAKVGKVGKAGRAGRADADADVDLDAADFDVPEIRIDVVIDLDVDIDLDIDVPGGRPDVPVNGMDAPGTGPDAPGNGTDAPGSGADAPGNGMAAPGTGADAPGNGTDAPGDGAETPANTPGDNGSGTPGAQTDPLVADRTPNTNVDFQASPDFDNAVDARQDAVADRREAVADRAAAISALDDLGIRVETGDLTKSKIDATIDDLIDDVRSDTSLTPDEVTQRLDALDALREASWAERESFVNQVNASEAMGDAGARDAIRSQDADVVVDGGGASAGQFDQVGLTHDGRTLIVAEAKGGSADLSSSGRVLPDGTRAAQGSTAYFNEIFRIDPSLQRWLSENPSIAQGLLDGSVDVRYQLVRTDGNGVVRIEDLALDARSLDLQIESVPARELVGAGGVNAGTGAPIIVDSIVADAPVRTDIGGPSDSSFLVDNGGGGADLGDGAGAGGDGGGAGGSGPSGPAGFGASEAAQVARLDGDAPVLDTAGRDISSALRASSLTPDDLAAYLYATDPDAFDDFVANGAWPEDVQVPKGQDVLAVGPDETLGVDWSEVPQRGYVLDASGQPIRDAHVPAIGSTIDRYGPPNGTFTSPVPDSGPYVYDQRSLPFVEDPGHYHQYEITGDLGNLRPAYDAAPAEVRAKIDWAIEKGYFTWGKTPMRGEIAPGFGSRGGGTQIELPLPVRILEELGVLREI